MRYFITILVFTLHAGCETENPSFKDIQNTPSPGKSTCEIIDGWTIPTSEIIGGGVGKDGIPSLENPTFIPREEVDFLSNTDLLVGVQIENETRLFPHRILDSHEVVNDRARSDLYTLTFCPLTGSTVAFYRGSEDSYGVSGLLHNANLIYFNRTTDTYWSQMKLTAVRGEQICDQNSPIGTVEMTWAGWKNTTENFSVLSRNTGFEKDYSTSFSKSILEDNTPLWPYSPVDERLKNFERVYVLFVNEKPKVYPLNVFNDQTQITEDAILGTEIFILSNRKNGLITAFLNEEGLNYSISQTGNELSISNDGKSWDIFGNPTNGSHESLTKPTGFIAYWFSVGAMYPNVEIYNPHDKD